MHWIFMVIVALLLYAGTVCAQEPSRYEGYGGTPKDYYAGVDAQVTFELLEEKQEDGAIARIVFRNTLTMGQPESTEMSLDTDLGRFDIIVYTTTNIDCAPVKECPDSLEVVNWPYQLRVSPIFIEVDEKDVGEVRVYLAGGV